MNPQCQYFGYESGKSEKLVTYANSTFLWFLGTLLGQSSLSNPKVFFVWLPSSTDLSWSESPCGAFLSVPWDEIFWRWGEQFALHSNLYPSRGNDFLQLCFVYLLVLTCVHEILGTGNPRSWIRDTARKPGRRSVLHHVVGFGQPRKQFIKNDF